MNINSYNSHFGKACTPVGKWLINRKLRKLKLNDAQKEQLDTVLEIASSAHQEHQLFNTELQQRFTTMMTEDRYDRKKAEELIRKATNQHAEHAAEVAGAFADLYEILAPGQQQQVLAMWQKSRRCRSHRCH